MNIGKLIVARHHESEWNKLGLWTGKRDRHLTPFGFSKSEEMGKLIGDIKVDYAFASMQVRSIETLSCMLNTLGVFDVPTEHLSSFNERDYGEYTGKNKWDMETILGREGWERVRRGWDVEVPGGETLKMVYDRVVPCFKQKILPLLLEGKNILIVAHGNSLRALTKYIESVSEKDIEDVEVPFGSVTIYSLDEEGHMISKDVRLVDIKSRDSKSRKSQIVATIGPASSNLDTLKDMALSGMDLVRINFSWGDLEYKIKLIESIRAIESEIDIDIPVIADVPGPRIQHGSTHSFNDSLSSSITDKDIEYITFAIKNDFDFIALSFVANADDIHKAKEIISSYSGKQKIIAKIERKEAIQNLESIVEASDAVMVARGDLGENLPLEELPFLEERIIKEANKAGKPVIVASELLLSMVSNSKPTRAEVTDTANAILQGADALMLSEETARGNYPVETVAMMDSIITEAEKHLLSGRNFNLLKKVYVKD